MGILALAQQRGFNRDRSAISSDVVLKKLRENSRIFYDRDLEIWDEYEKEFGPSDPRDMQVMKHFAEFLALGTKGKLDKTNQLPTTDSVRNKMRRFYSNWQRKNQITIPTKVTRSMCPYIEGELTEKLGLKNINREQGFLTHENFVKLHEKLWFNDHHDYVHEGYRVDNATLLNCHCYTSARVSELCQAKYEDAVFMVGWEKGEPEFKLKIERRICKGKDKGQPEHVMYEKLTSKRGPPPLYAQPMLFFLANFLSSGAIKGDPTLADLLSYTPPQHSSFWVFEWKEEMRHQPIFPNWNRSGPGPSARSSDNWSRHASRWATRAGFINGCGMHCARRNSLLKATDSGASIEQVLKFADQQNSAVLRRNYLGSMNTIDGTASFLGMDARQDLTEDFRSATMKWVMNLPLGLSARAQAELAKQEDWMQLSQEVADLTLQISQKGTSEIIREQLKTRRNCCYKRRRQLEASKLREIQEGQVQGYSIENEMHEQGDWRHGHFARIMHFLPERFRLSQTLFSTVPLRSPEGLSALQDLISLRKNPCHIAYQSALRPLGGICAVPGCRRNMESIPTRNLARWKHAFHCWEEHYGKQSSFAQFCSICNQWVEGESQWTAHCHDHIENQQLPFRCDPIILRNAIACPGYCPVHLGSQEYPASQRLQQFWDQSGWQRHVAGCVSRFIESQPDASQLQCPHPACPIVSTSSEDFWLHLADIHSTSQEPAKKRKISYEDDLNDDNVSRLVKKRSTQSPTSRQMRQTLSKNDIHHAFIEWNMLENLPENEVQLEGDSSHPSELDENEKIGHEIGRLSVSDIQSSSTGIESVTQIDDNSCDSLLLPHGHDVTLDSENSYSKHTTNFPQNVFAVRLDQISVTHNKDQDDKFRNAREASRRLESILSSSEDSGVVDPQLYVNRICEEDLQTREVSEPSSSQKVASISQAGQPVALDPDEAVWEVDQLLARWKQGRQTFYLVKWKGFTDDANTWEKRMDISNDLVSQFDKRFDEDGGNHEGIELLGRRMRRRQVEYLVKWKGRPENDNSWEKKTTISRRRILDYDSLHGF